MKKEYIKPAIVEELMLVAEEQILTASQVDVPVDDSDYEGEWD